MRPAEIAFVRRVLILGGVAVIAFLAWRLRQVALLLFGSVMVSTALRSLSEPLVRRTRLGDGLAVVIAFLALLLTLVVFGAFFGWRIQAQIAMAADLLPQAFTLFIAQVGANPLGARVLADLAQSHVSAVISALLYLPAYAFGAVATIAEAVLVVAGGIYLAAQPALYRRGLMHLVPRAARTRTLAIMDDVVRGLRQWLLAQFVAMVTVGLMVGLGLWAVGVPAPAALGLLAGLAEFVPFAGPVAAAAPAILLGLMHGVGRAGWTLLLFVVIQSIESNLLLPLIQRRIVRLPPVLTMFALVSFGVVFGPLGILMATPLMVICVVLVRHLHLGDATPPDVDVEEHRRPQ